MCDTAVALGDATDDGSVIFAKNSDRPANECQPLGFFPGRSFPAGTPLRCTWIEVPQARETFAVLGSRPYWMWGFEMGVNEHGVAIGNEAVHSREPYAEVGLLGMDLIRLGLERGRTAYDAMHVIINLLEEFGQGGSCDVAIYRTYHNSFILADAREAWVLETAGRRWAAVRARGRRTISNVYTIETEWDEASPDLVEHAMSEAWWPSGKDFNFAEAYREPEYDARSGACRFARSSSIVEGRVGLDRNDMASVLRDHDGEEDPDRFPICVHARPPGRLGETAASLVVRLRRDGPVDERTLAWTSFGSPCSSALLPTHVGSVIPATILGMGGAQYSDASPWWHNERIQRRTELYPSLRPMVREYWRRFETEIAAETAALDAEVAALDPAGARSRRQEASDRYVERYLQALSELESTTAAEAAALPRPDPSTIGDWAPLNEPVGLGSVLVKNASREALTVV